MNDTHIGLIGVLAGICTTVSFVPQILKIRASGHTRDISLWMFAILTTGVFLWLVYGIYLGEFPIIAANLVSTILCSYILVKKLSSGDRG